MILLSMAFAAEVCRLGQKLTWKGQQTACSVHGHAVAGGKRIFVVDCNRKENVQIEYENGADTADIVDLISREKVSDCKVDRKAIKKLISDYQVVERPPDCHLENQTGQMKYFTKKSHGRCSFRMNKVAYQQFVTMTGKKPFYQCENDHFLVVPAGGDSEIFAKTGPVWNLECKGHLYSTFSDNGKKKPAEEPESFYQPPEPTLVP